MARIAVVDAGAGVTTAIEAVALGHELVPCTLASVPAGADLVIIDHAGAKAAEVSVLRGLDERVPVLLLVARKVVVADAVQARPGLAVLRKPAEIFELRRNIAALLSLAPEPLPAVTAAATPASAQASGVSLGSANADTAGATPASRKPAPALDWLASPLVPARVAAILASARQMRTSLWVVGEIGSGREQVSLSLIRRHRDEPALVTWFAGQPFHEVSALCSDARACLFVPEIEARSLSDQLLLEHHLAGNEDSIVVATSADDPADAVVSGAMSRSLYHLLARVAVRLPPLRERRTDIAGLVETITSSAFPARSVSLSAAAAERLEQYPWPGNVSELQGVLLRSVMVRGADADSAVVLDAGDLQFEPLLAIAEPPVATPVARIGVVVPLSAASRRQEDKPVADVAASAEVATTSIEHVLAGLAHDLRNPMATIKTFASLAAAAAVATGDDGAELAILADQACTRVDGHLDLLQRYADLCERDGGEVTDVDLVSTISEAMDNLPEACPASMGARRPVRVRMDPHHARFIAEALLEESRARLANGEEASIDTGTTSGSIELRVPLADTAIGKLAKWVRGQALPWRLALAREVSRRGGGDVEVVADRDELHLVWQAPALEEADDGEQARGADRRRRSRSS